MHWYIAAILPLRLAERTGYYFYVLDIVLPTQYIGYKSKTGKLCDIL